MRLKYLFLLLSGGLLQPAAAAPYLEELTRIRTLLEIGDFRGALVQAKQHLARMGFTLEVRSLAELKRALAQVADVKGVLSASRR